MAPDLGTFPAESALKERPMLSMAYGVEVDSSADTLNAAITDLHSAPLQGDLVARMTQG